MKSALRAFAALFACGASLIWAQQELTVQWKLTLQDLEQRLATLPDSGEALAAWRDDAEALRTAIAEFAQANPADGIEVPRALPKTPGSPFNLGHVQVDVSATLAEDSPVTVGIDQTRIAQLDLVNAAKALDYLPGVDIQHLSANRNEAGIMVRRFSTRGQVPLYIDGIPISVPYDGYVDFNRYLTSDISDIEVARGYSTPLLPRNKFVGTVSFRFPHQILAIVNERYESGLLLQDTTYATNSPLFLPYSVSYATTNIFAMIPVAKGFTMQAGIKNLFDRNYYYTAGYPEAGRNWIVNMRYHF